MVKGFRGDVISVNDVAKQWHVHVSTVYRWAGSGVRGRRLPSMLIGGRRYVRISDLEVFIEATPPDATTSEDQRNRAAQQQLASFGLTAKQNRSSKS